MIIDPMANATHSDRAEPPALPCRDLTACPLCSGEQLLPARFEYVFKGTRFPAVRCASCGFTFLSRQPTSDALTDLYDADYFASDYHCGHEEESYFATEAEQVASANVLLEWIERAVRPGRILELGCAGGYFLRAARDRGWSPVGIEISEAAADFARQRLGLEVHTGTLAEARLEDSSFDAAYLGDVLEHVTDPLATLIELHRLLRPGGALLIAGPITINSLDRRLGLSLYRGLGRSKTLHQPPYHVTEFTPATLRRGLTGSGFHVRWLRQSKIPPAWRNPRRRPLLEHCIKLLLDGPNWALTRLLGRLGDRAIVLAVKPEG